MCVGRERGNREEGKKGKRENVGYQECVLQRITRKNSALVSVTCSVSQSKVKARFQQKYKRTRYKKGTMAKLKSRKLYTKAKGLPS